MEQNFDKNYRKTLEAQIQCVTYTREKLLRKQFS